MKSRKVDTVMHFAGSIVVPELVADPLGYYSNNTVKSRELIAAAVSNGVRKIRLLLDLRRLWRAGEGAGQRGTPLDPMSPYGASKPMTERMLTDCSAAYGLR